MPAPPLSLKGRVLRLLSQREHSKAELARKLRELETEDGELARVLDDFEAKGLISESRVANSVVNTRASKLGGMRIRAELQAKGLSDDVVRDAVSNLKESEAARAQAVWAKRFGRAPVSASERAKHMRFLATRGFDGGLIRAVVPAIVATRSSLHASDDGGELGGDDDAFGDRGDDGYCHNDDI
jgi:regulatory protein